MPGFRVINEQWKELHAYFQHQAQLPHHIEAERMRAKSAITEKDYEKARKHLETVSEWTRHSYSEHEKSFAHASEEYGRALASLGALAFTSLDFAEARVQFGKTLMLPHLPAERMDRYRQSYLIASTALAAMSNSETEARAILAR